MTGIGVRQVRMLRSEAAKLLTLGSCWIACAVSVVGTTGLSLMNASISGDPALASPESALENAYYAAPIGFVGAVILGVTIMSSEYTRLPSESGGGRQITTTFLTMPGRVAVLATKSLVLTLAVTVLSLLTLLVASVAGWLATELPMTPDVAGSQIAAEVTGLVCYAVLLSLLALAITVLTRGGIIPMIVLVANYSVVSVTYLLTLVIPAARWLPDMAGRALVPGLAEYSEDLLTPAQAAGVMGGWALALLIIAGYVLVRRDA